MSSDVSPPPDVPTRIDATFRNGSLTAIGVVLGFSLGFLSRWAGMPGNWSGTDLFAVAAISAGIALQVISMSNLLGIRSLEVVLYERAVRFFMIGLILVSLGVVFALFADLLGFGGQALRS